MTRRKWCRDSISAIQHCSTLIFQKLHNLVRLVSFDSHFLQRRSKVSEKRIKVSVGQTLLPRPGVGRGQIFAFVSHAPAKDHGDKHPLPGEKVLQVGILEEVTNRFIVQDSSIKLL